MAIERIHPAEVYADRENGIYFVRNVSGGFTTYINPEVLFTDEGFGRKRKFLDANPGIDRVINRSLVELAVYLQRKNV